MRQSVASVALIRRTRLGRTEWLAQWNAKWQRYHFVAGHKLPDESFRECVVREMHEELGLREGEDFEVGAEPVTEARFNAYSRSAHAETAYTMALFDVTLTSDAARRRVPADDRNRWLTASEIRTGLCGDGRDVSENMALLLGEAGIAP